jgi:hypothetical protein
MCERDDAGRKPVSRKRGMAVNDHLELVLGCIIADFAHDWSPGLYCQQSSAKAVSGKSLEETKEVA